ncbi:MAG: hypothetical protein V3R52_02335, partial [Candidatus Neomarinimicrobiota bacterium]
EPVIVNTEPKDIDIIINHLNSAVEELTNSTLLYPQSKSDSISIYSIGNLIYSGQPFSVPVPIVTKRKWWSFILGNPLGYVVHESPIETLVFKFPEKVQFEKLPKLIDGWELLFFIGIFISAITLRIIFKVQ